MFLVNSRHRHFTAAYQRFAKYFTYAEKHPFSRSYGVILPSSLTRVLSSALVRLYPPTGVGLRYGSHMLRFGAFLGSRESTARIATRIGSQPYTGDYPIQPTAFHRHPTGGRPILLRPSSHTYASTEILIRFPSTTLFSLALGAD